MSRSISTQLTIGLALVLGTAAASAQPDPAKPAPVDPMKPTGKAPTEDELAKNKTAVVRPWAEGVSESEQQIALALFNEGNSLLRDALFPKAVEKYREALGHWKHPAIYYNLALALVNLDQPLEMYDALEAAMAYGSAPLDEDKYERAKGYKILVEKQIGYVEYELTVTGATLVLDGKEVFTGPGTYKSRVRAGEHTVVARAEGYTPVPLTVKILGGTTSAITIPMYTDAELTREERRMPNWVPYSVLGAGVVLGGVGALLHTSAKTSFDEYDQAITDCSQDDDTSGGTGGCQQLPSGVADMKSSAESKQTMAITAYAVGGVAIAAGVVLVILNRPKTYRIDPTKGQSDLAITPVLGREQAGFAVTGTFW